MLQSLRVKNLALLEEAEVEFGPGLNIFTGETGAGKSLLMGSVNLALGGKFDKDMLRAGAESALVELVFSAEDERIREKLRNLELEDSEEDSVIITRKIQAGKSVCRINGETVTAKQLKELAEVLIDIYGQHEHQSLLNRKKHREILDAFCGEEIEPLLRETAERFQKCRELRTRLEEESLDEASRAKEQALAEFEWKEIQEANLRPGEDEELERQYRRMANARKITQNLTESYAYTGNEGEFGAGVSLSRALRNLRGVTAYDERLEQLESQLSEVDNLLADFNRDIAEYLSECEFDDEEFCKVEERLDYINRLKGKYGNTIDAILAYGQQRCALLEKLSDYDTYLARLRNEYEDARASLESVCDRLSKVRSRNALLLSDKLKAALVNLNFLTVEFETMVRPGQTISETGSDEVEFLISVNPGEALKPLGQVASGGELSRVMLAIKTVMAGKDDIDTLIFDEIDAGISGRTAWRVSELLSEVAGEHQVICITHLPQIAAMADCHFEIAKHSENGNTVTQITSLKEEQSLAELARLLGSDSLSEEALANAARMRGQALAYKQNTGR